MTLPDDETLAEEVLTEPTDAPADKAKIPAPTDLESGMDTGQGADDEPELSIGDRHTSDAERISPDKARRLLGDKSG